MTDPSISLETSAMEMDHLGQKKSDSKRANLSYEKLPLSRVGRVRSRSRCCHPTPAGISSAAHSKCLHHRSSPDADCMRATNNCCGANHLDRDVQILEW